MEEIKKKQTQILSDLKSGNETIVLSALKQVPEHGSPAMMPQLIRLMNQNLDGDISKQLEKILFNLKDPNVIPALIDILNDKSNKELHTTTLSVIWQSGLDVSEHLELITDLAIQGDYMTAVECMTIIDNQEVYKDEALQAAIKKLDTVVKKEGETKALLVSLRQIILDKLLG